MYESHKYSNTSTRCHTVSRQILGGMTNTDPKRNKQTAAPRPPSPSLPTPSPSVHTRAARAPRVFHDKDKKTNLRWKDHEQQMTQMKESVGVYYVGYAARVPPNTSSLLSHETLKFARCACAAR